MRARSPAATIAAMTTTSRESRNPASARDRCQRSRDGRRAIVTEILAARTAH
jgi:hypothetical protein